MPEIINNADFMMKAISKNNYIDGSAIVGCNPHGDKIVIEGVAINENFVVSMDARIAKHPGYYLAPTTRNVTATVGKGAAWAGDNTVLFQAPAMYGITITRIDVVAVGTNPDLTFNLEIRAWDLDSTGTEVWTADKHALATGASITSFTNAALTVEQYLVLVPVAETGTVDSVTITIYFRRT